MRACGTFRKALGEVSWDTGSLTCHTRRLIPATWKGGCLLGLSHMCSGVLADSHSQQRLWRWIMLRGDGEKIERGVEFANLADDFFNTTLLMLNHFTNVCA